MPVDQQLYDAGLVLQAVIEVEDCHVSLPERALGYRQLVVLGHGGTSFFDQTALQASDPLDERTIDLFESFMARVGCSEFEVLYPLRHDVIDLRSLGLQLGWQQSSQLGIGIHPVWGTWFAYRLVAATNTDLPVTVCQKITSPCETCKDKPCLSACPASAPGDTFQLNACSEERLRVDSDCADRCLAREACPVGREHQYSREQIQYHYQRSLQALKKYVGRG